MSIVPTVEPAWDARHGKHIESDVRAGGDCKKQTFAVGSEKDVARPVMSQRNAFDDALGLSGGLEVAVFVGETNNTVAAADIHPLGIGSGRVESDSVRLMKAGGEDFADGGPGRVGRDAVGAHLVRGTIRDEKIAVWRHANDAGLCKARCNELDRKSIGNSRHGSRRPRNDLGVVWPVLADLRQILCSD